MQRSYFRSILRLCIAASTMAVAATGALAAKHSETDKVASIKQTLQARLPDMKVIDVRPSKIGPLYEVFTGKTIVYADSTADHLIYGDVVETLTKKNVTAERVNERTRIDFESLPFDRAIKIVRGNGTRRLAIFSDPDCPFCRELEQQTQSVDDVAMYVFLFPLTAKHPNAERHAKAIWCSNDRAAAWTAWMLSKTEPPDRTCNGEPMDSIAALADNLHVVGTPTLYFENGHRYDGGMSAAQLQKALTENAQKTARESRGRGAGHAPDDAEQTSPRVGQEVGTPVGVAAKDGTQNAARASEAASLAGCKAPTPSEPPAAASCTR